MKESEIRPRDIFNEYLRLAREDVQIFFAEAKKLQLNCPACDAPGEHAFHKTGFDYSLCHKCLTLYVDPRPEAQAFTNYYLNSPSSKFWTTTFYKETAGARREKIWKPKAQLLAKLLKEQNASDHLIIDVGGGYGIFAEEMQRYSSAGVLVVEPAPHLADVCRGKGFRVIQKFLEAISPGEFPIQSKTFVSFELFEHLHDPRQFLAHLNDLMCPKDLFIFTTLSGTGLDIQILWENSPSVSPPHHLNFFNPGSAKLILEKTGFECVFVDTPGELDIDILNNQKTNINDRFWKTFLAISSEECKQKWQSLISESGWSSHMMVVARKV